MITTSPFTTANPSQEFPLLIDNSIYPFFFDGNFASFRCGSNCNLFYRVNPDQETLNNITKLVQSKYQIDETTGFTPLREETSIITWSKVPEYPNGDEVGESNQQNFFDMF